MASCGARRQTIASGNSSWMGCTSLVFTLSSTRFATQITISTTCTLQFCQTTSTSRHPDVPRNVVARNRRSQNPETTQISDSIVQDGRQTGQEEEQNICQRTAATRQTDGRRWKTVHECPTNLTKLEGLSKLPFPFRLTKLEVYSKSVALSAMVMLLSVTPVRTQCSSSQPAAWTAHSGDISVAVAADGCFAVSVADELWFVAAEPVSLVSKHTRLRAGSDLTIAAAAAHNGSDGTGPFRGFSINWTAVDHSVNLTTAFALYDGGQALSFSQTFHSKVSGSSLSNILSAQTWGSPSSSFPSLDATGRARLGGTRGLGFISYVSL